MSFMLERDGQRGGHKEGKQRFYYRVVKRIKKKGTKSRGREKRSRVTKGVR